jgi:D-glucuronyl C5-epimerase C-terminus
LSSVLAGKTFLAAALVAALALLGAATSANAGTVLEFRHGQERVVQDQGTPIASAAQEPPETGGTAPPPPTTPTPAPTPQPGTSITPGVVGRGTVPAVLDQALAKGLINQGDHDTYRANYDQAIAARSSLAGQCRKQLRNVINELDAMSRNGSLTSTRMPALFLQLRRNTEFWSSHPRVASGQRVKFGSSELLFQHYANQGIQLQPLGNFGKANGLYTQCLHPTKDKPCERAKLKTLLDELLQIKSVRGSFYTWEYFFPFSGGHPPWMSGMAQATGVEALARASQLFDDQSYVRLAGQMIGAFKASPPVGTRVSAFGGNHYLIYSFAPRYHVLNAFLQTLIGLHDYTKITGDPDGQALFDAGNVAAHKELPKYDTGKWAYYSLPSKEQSTYGYMSLVTGFLDGLCQRTGDSVYCSYAKRWHRYLSKVPSEPVRPLPPMKECGY